MEPVGLMDYHHSIPYIKIVEQPAAKSLRFRYLCEGRSAGSIPGVNSTQENKTFPTIEIVGYSGDVIVEVSCVTKDEPFRPHPHNLVGKDCNEGICTMRLTGESLRAVFSNLGIQCVRKKDIKETLEVRERRQIDPFNTGFNHKNQPSDIDVNAVRLCFEAYTPTGRQKLTAPVVSDVIYDKKALSDLVICRLCRCSAKVGGGDEIILLCEKVAKEDIKVHFYEMSSNGEVVWSADAEFQPTDIHKSTAIAFKTPRYPHTDILQKAKVYLQLLRPSDGVVSESIPFEYYPDPGMRTFSRIHRKLKHKQDLDIFQQILSLDSETTATKYSCQPPDLEGFENDDDDNDNDTVSTDSSASKPNSSDTLNEYEEAIKRQTESEAEGGAEFERARDMEIELEVPQITYPAADESTQTSTPMDEILKQQHLDSPSQLSALYKITEWMRSSEFERTDSLTVENGDNTSLSPVTVHTNVTCLSAGNNTTFSTVADDDQTFTDLMEQVAKMDEIFAESRRDTLDNPIIKELPIGGLSANEIDVPEVGEINKAKETAAVGSASAQASLEIDEHFDETATYTSLQIAFKNPVNMPHQNQQQQQQLYQQQHQAHLEQLRKSSNIVLNEEDGLVVLTNPPAPKIRVNAVQTPPSPPSPPLPLPPRSPSPIFDQRLPPLPPKRKTSQEISSSDQTSCSSRERSRNGSVSSRPFSQIIIMRTPDQSPTKRPPTPTPTSASPKKKQGFFSRLFSRRKIKTDNPNPANINNNSNNNSNTNISNNSNSPIKANNSKATTPVGSREPSIGHFSFADANRSSMRSAKSIPIATSSSSRLSPQNSTNIGKSGKPVARSVSSVSGKRPANLTADVIHIPLKGESSRSLPPQEGYTAASNNTITFSKNLDRKTLSALQLADITVCDGTMELVAIADRQSIRNLCEGAYGVVLDPSVDLSEAEHFALYTSIPPPDDASNETASYYEQLQRGQILSADEIARRLAEANSLQ